MSSHGTNIATIIVGVGRVGGYLLNLLDERKENVAAVVSRSGADARVIQKQKAQTTNGYVPFPEYNAYIPAFPEIEPAVEFAITNGYSQIRILDASEQLNFINTIDHLTPLAGKYPHIQICAFSCTPDQNGQTEKKINEVNQLGLPNLFIARDDLKSTEIQDAITRNYLVSQQYGGQIIITDIHRAEKEPLAAVTKLALEKLVGKKAADAAYAQALAYYNSTKGNIYARDTFPIPVDERISVSSFRSLPSRELNVETAIIIEVFNNKGEQMSVIGPDGLPVNSAIPTDSIVISAEKYGKVVAERLAKFADEAMRTRNAAIGTGRNHAVPPVPPMYNIPHPSVFGNGTPAVPPLSIPRAISFGNETDTRNAGKQKRTAAAHNQKPLSKQ